MRRPKAIVTILRAAVQTATDYLWHWQQLGDPAVRLALLGRAACRFGPLWGHWPRWAAYPRRKRPPDTFIGGAGI